MLEHLTQAVVLGFRPRKESDRIADLYTRDFGRLEARVVGGRRILSKLAPHLDLFNLVTVRLVEKNHVTVADVLTDSRFGKERRRPNFYPKFLGTLSLLRALVPKAEPDPRLWHFLVKSLQAAEAEPETLLKILGYDPRHAGCDICRKRPVAAFRAEDQSFFCGDCVSKVRSDEIVYL